MMDNLPEWVGGVLFVAIITIQPTILLLRRQTIVRDCKHNWIQVTDRFGDEVIGRHSKCLNCGVKR